MSSFYQVQSANEKLLKLLCTDREREEEEKKQEAEREIVGRTRAVRKRNVFVEENIEDKQLRRKPKTTNCVTERGTGKKMEGVKMLRAPVGKTAIHHKTFMLLGIPSALD